MESNGYAMELQMLSWAIALGLLQLVMAASLSTMQRGLKWNTGARDGEPKPLNALASRVDRAFRNFLETFPFFAVAVLAVIASGRASADTALGAQLYLWGRVAYVPLYAAGVPWLRTVAWAVSLVGIIKLVKPLF